MNEVLEIFSLQKDIMLDNVTHNKNILSAKNIDLDSILLSLASRKGNKVKVNSKKQLDAFFESSKSKFEFFSENF